MLSPIKVVDIELSQPLTTLEGLQGYKQLQGLVRLRGTPIGYITAPIVHHCCEATMLSQLVLEQHSQKIIHHLLVNGLMTLPQPQGLQMEELLRLPPSPLLETFPLVTVAVCTRDRPADLALCLDALCQLNYPALDLLVVDNAPTSDTTKELVQQYPSVRYIDEPRPGLDWARNRAILEAKGEIIAYTDDDVVVDPDWVTALASVFVDSPEVMAVTGLVVPYELETEAQILFEMNGGFGKGFERQWHQIPPGQKMPWGMLGTGQFGTGANMAYRRSLFQLTGGFDPALDVGTVTHGAGDLEMFFRVLKTGYTLVYEPGAIVRHRHRRTYEKLRSQITHHGSTFAYFVCGATHYPEEIRSFVRLGLSWLWSGHLRPLLMSWFYPGQYPRDLILAQLWGCLVGLTRYPQACKLAAEIASQFSNLPTLTPSQTSLEPSLPNPSSAIAVRTVDLAQPLMPLTDLANYGVVRVFVVRQHLPLGSVDIANCGQSVGVLRLTEAIAKTLNLRLLNSGSHSNQEIQGAAALATLTQHLSPPAVSAPTLPSRCSVSIIIGTYDRPQDLRHCLQYLIAQKSPRSIEIIVVDNHPESGVTPPVVAEFPQVKLVSEPRQGVAYARNAGIAASNGEILVTIDDDVTTPADWLEKLIAPFARADVMGVTGNVLPLELETSSQQLFEQYGNGGLGRGFDRLEVGTAWFERSWQVAVPTWELGGTANSAFRASIFHHPEIGLMDEALGPGMPSGVGEDIYLFYKVLKAGYTFVYEPSAYVWHKHRRDLSALRRQLYNYSKGFVSYHLTTCLHDHDLRALFTLLFFLPLYHIKQLFLSVSRRRHYPLSLVLLEIAGNLAGAWSLWRSRQRVKRQGRSTPYVPTSGKLASDPTQAQTTAPLSVSSS